VVLAVAATLVAAWLLLAPLTVMYKTGGAGNTPLIVTTRASWRTTEQTFVFSDSEPGQPAHVITGARLDCGGVFTTGSGEQKLAPDGPLACDTVETPRRVMGLVVLGLVAAFALAGAARDRPLPGQGSV
jgi:hypothetical protein